MFKIKSRRGMQALFLLVACIFLSSLSVFRSLNDANGGRMGFPTTAPVSSWASTGDAGLISTKEYVTYRVSLMDAWRSTPEIGSGSNFNLAAIDSIGPWYNGIMPTWSTYAVVCKASAELAGQRDEAAGTYADTQALDGTYHRLKSWGWDSVWESYYMRTFSTSVSGYTRFDNRRMGGNVQAGGRVEWLSWWGTNGADNPISQRVSVIVGEYTGENPQTGHTYFNAHYSTWSGNPAPNYGVWYDFYNTVDWGTWTDKDAAWLDNWEATPNYMMMQVHNQVSTWPSPEIYIDYLYIYVPMLKSAQLEQNLNTDLKIPSGWNLESATLGADGLRMPIGVNLVKTVGASDVIVENGAYIDPRPIGAKSVIDAVDTNGVMHLKVTSGSSSYADWGNGGVSDWNVILKESQYAYASDMYVDVVISKPSSGQVTYQATAGGITSYTQAIRIENPLSTTISDPSWVTGYTKITKLVSNFYPNSEMYLDYTIYDAVAGADSYISHAGNTFSTVGGVGNPAYTINTPRPGFGTWLDGKLSGFDYIDASLVWRERFSAVKSVAVKQNLAVGSHGPGSQDLMVQTKFVAGEEICIIVNIDAKMLDYKAIAQMEIEYKLIGTSTVTGSFNPAAGDFYQPGAPGTVDIYMYKLLSLSPSGSITVQASVSAKDSGGKYRHTGFATQAGAYTIQTFAFSSIGLPNPYNSTHASWSFSVDSVTTMRDVLAASLNVNNAITTQVVTQTSWLQPTQHPSMTFTGISTTANVFMRSKPFSLAIDASWASSPTTATVSISITSTDNPLHYVYKQTGIAWSIASGVNTWSVNIDPDTIAYRGNMPIRNAPYMIVIEYTIGSTTYTLQSLHVSAQNTIKNSIVMMGLTSYAPNTPLPAWDATKLANIHTIDYVLLEDITTTGLITVQLRTIVLAGSTVVEQANYYGSVVIADVEPYTAQTLAYTAITGQNFPSISDYTYPPGWQHNINSPLVIEFSITDIDGDLLDANVQYKVQNSTMVLSDWSVMPKVAGTVYRISIANCKTFGFYPVAEQYNITVRATDSALHQVKVSRFLRIVTAAPVMQSITLKKGATTYYPPPTSEIPHFIRYDWVSITATFQDTDQDTNAIDCYYRIEGLTVSYTSANKLLTQVSKVGDIYTFKNLSSEQFLGLPEAGLYMFSVHIQDAWDNVATGSFQFYLDIYSPELVQGSLLPAAPANTFTHYQPVMTRMQFKDLDNDVVWCKINVTSWGGGATYNLADFLVTPVYDVITSAYTMAYTFPGSIGSPLVFNDGTYKVYFKVMDGFGSDVVEYYTFFTIASSSPRNLVVASPTTGSYSPYNLIPLTFEVYDDDLDLGTTAQYFVFNASGFTQPIQTVSLASQSTNFYRFTGTFDPAFYSLYEGDYLINVTVTDALGHKMSIIGSFRLVSAPPSVSFTLPSDDAHVSKYATMYVEALVSDPDGDLNAVAYKVINGTTELTGWISMYNNTAGQPLLFKPVAGYSLLAFRYNSSIFVQVRATDDMGHVVMIQHVVHVDVFAPRIDQIAPDYNTDPVGSTFKVQQTMEVSCRVQDADNDMGSGTVKVIIKLVPKTGFETFSPVTISLVKDLISNIWRVNVPLVSLNSMYVNDYYYEIVINATDANGNVVLSNQTGIPKYFKVANQAPSFNTATPAPSSVFTYNANMALSTNVTDVDTDLKFVTYSIYTSGGVPVVFNVSMSGGLIPLTVYYIYSATYIPASNLPNGTYTVVFNATDNYRLTTTRTFQIYIYNYVPRMSAIVPVQGTIFGYQNSVAIKANITDLDNDVTSVKLESVENGIPMNHSMVKTLSGVLSRWEFTFNFQNHTALYESLVFTLHFTDAYGHASVAVVNYIVQNYAPSAQVTMPMNMTSYYTSESVSVKAVVMDLDNDVSSVVAFLIWKTSRDILSATVPMTFNPIDSTWGCSIPMAPYRPYTGAWELHVVVTDAIGNSAENASIEVNLVNMVPLVAIEAPLVGQELKTSFAIVANILDIDGDLNATWFRIGSFAPVPLVFSSGKYRAAVNPYMYPWGTYTLVVSANDSAGQLGTSSMTVHLHPPEIFVVPEGNISYRVDGVTEGGYIEATIQISHNATLQSLDCWVIIPSWWTDVVLNIDEVPIIRRGLKSFKDTNLANVTFMKFERFDLFQPFDQVYFKIRAPALQEAGISTGENGESYYKYTMTSKRAHTNIVVPGMSILVTAAPSNYIFRLEVQIGITWTDVSVEYDFQVTGEASATATFKIPSIMRGDTINIRIVKILKPSNAFNTEPLFYGAMLAGGIGGLATLALFAMKKKFDWDISNKKLGLICVAMIGGLFVVGLFI